MHKMLDTSKELPTIMATVERIIFQYTSEKFFILIIQRIENVGYWAKSNIIHERDIFVFDKYLRSEFSILMFFLLSSKSKFECFMIFFINFIANFGAIVVGY